MGSIGEALAHAERLAAARPDLALLQIDEILRAAPGMPQALLIKGRAQRLSGKIEAARETLSGLMADQPRSAATALELGLVHYLMGDAAAATAAFQNATRLKPDMAEGWTALADVLRLAGDEAGADRAYLAGVRASAGDPVLMEAALALSDNRLDVAERMLRDRLKERPTDVAAIRMLAELAGRLGRYRDAASLLERAIELAPGFIAARHNYALVLHRLSRGEEALAVLDPLLAADPANPSYRNLKAAILSGIGDFEQAIAIYRDVLEAYPNQPKVWMSLGHMLKTLGRQDESIAAYRRAIALQPGLGEAWWSLANLKTIRFTDEDVAAMCAALDAPDLDGEDRFHLEFALGKAEEDAGHAEASFAHYVEGNRGRRAVIDYDAAGLTRAVARNEALYTADFFAEREGWGCPARDPIFVVSLPRSGSTLIEQILSSHSEVEGTSELPDIAALVAETGPGKVADLDREAVRALGDAYLDRTRVQRKTGRPLFIDKMPNNWAFTGFIRLILPNATIIDARRHPLGCCLSNFKQHFARGQTFTYDLADIGHYYRDYVRWMAHLDRVQPGKVHRVFYERMVEDQEAETRALLAAVGLPFEEACLRFHETERAVRTASSEQVRRPIFRDGMEQWKQFDRWLGPLKDALGPVLDAYPEVPA
ncbi:sulfotransferase [Sphingomonas sp. CGMCC 1.13654]|uniref:Sulfotransferase n=1 Tax=Sphingomonas chungangi TaxID=2683589 RepID=A0A838L9N2_9SPHN|nr:tetratricopeptide repeat-containing sulfotransferase family protein [Sphingomonas chungangi]MBA2934218.1 sulfotransferase [Sphingomonas chungangi]MVW57259.1 tetratricopeptide repeat protein [Sphingomonas chungangi]